MEKYGLTFIRFLIEELKRENFIRYYSKKCFYYL